MITINTRFLQDHAAFALAGLIYNVTENVASTRVSRSSQQAEADHAILAGITVKF